MDCSEPSGKSAVSPGPATDGCTVSPSPVAGIWTSLVFLGLVSVASAWTVWSSGDGGLDEDVVRQRSIFAGLAYGLFSGAVWWSSFMRTRWARWSVVGVCGGVLVVWLSVRHDRPYVRYVSFFAGMAIFQSIFFWFARVPSWVRNSRIADGEIVFNVPGRSSLRQFGLIDLIAMTLAVAILIAAGQRYQMGDVRGPGEVAKSIDLATGAAVLGPWGSYWLGVATVWIWLPVLSLSIAMLACCQRWWQGIAFLFLSLSTAATGAVVMAWLQANLQRKAQSDYGAVLGDYGTFVLLYAYLFGGLAIAGRWDSLGPKSQRRLTKS